jgi:DNA-binding transcriptional LysR family regulator
MRSSGWKSSSVRACCKGPRGAQITREGADLLERCDRLLEDLDDISALFRQGDQLRGRIRADMPLGLAAQVSAQLAGFLAAHPQLQVDLFSTDRRVDLLGEGFDLVVRVGAVVDQSLVARPLPPLELINVASPAYLAQHGTPATLDDLAQHWLVNYQPNPASQPAGFEYCDSASGQTHYLAMGHKVTVNNSVAYSAACRGGLGIAQLRVGRAGRHTGRPAGRSAARLSACAHAQPHPVSAPAQHPQAGPRIRRLAGRTGSDHAIKPAYWITR